MSRFLTIVPSFRSLSFSREIPTRFKKEVLQPYVDKEAGVIQIEEINRMLVNIGHGEDCLSSSEQALLLRAAGSNDRYLTVQQMQELLDG